MVKDSRSQGYKDLVCVRQLEESGLLANGIWHMAYGGSRNKGIGGVRE